MSTHHLAQPLTKEQASVLLHLRRVHNMPVSEVGRASGVYDPGLGWTRASYVLHDLEDLGLAKGHDDYVHGDYGVAHPKVYHRTTKVELGGRTIDLDKASVGELTSL